MSKTYIPAPRNVGANPNSSQVYLFTLRTKLQLDNPAYFNLKHVIHLLEKGTLEPKYLAYAVAVAQDAYSLSHNAPLKLDNPRIRGDLYVVLQPLKRALSMRRGTTASTNDSIRYCLRFLHALKCLLDQGKQVRVVYPASIIVKRYAKWAEVNQVKEA